MEDNKEPMIEMKEGDIQIGGTLDWKSIKMMAINRVGVMVKEDLIKWTLSVDFLENLMPELQTNDEYKTLILNKKKETERMNDTMKGIKEFYNFKFGEIVKHMVEKEPIDGSGKL